MLIFYIIISAFIAWIWVDYFRLIDIYEKENLKYIIPTFILGGTSVLIVDLAYSLFLGKHGLELNGNPLNDFLYATFQVGMLEEFSKLIPFIIMRLLFKKQFNEPIDYLAFICFSALGFSAVENVMYFHEHGAQIIDGRAILSTVGHMFDTALIAYGIILYRFKRSKLGVGIILIFFFFAALSHGIYDFWLMFEYTKEFGWLITIIYFLITISIFSIILNNALNNSSYFTYKKVIDSTKVSSHLLIYYAIVFALQLIFVSIQAGVEVGVIGLVMSIIFSGSIIIVTIVRLSRFKLIQHRWHPIKFELPFSFSSQTEYGSLNSRTRIILKGDSYNEVHLTKFYQEHFYLTPVSQRNTQLGETKLAYIERKVFLKNDESYFLVKVFHDKDQIHHDSYLLKPKKGNQTMVQDKYPIVAVLKIVNLFDLENSKNDHSKFRFVEWAYARPKN
ncbi:MAG: PrsW family intramembrane metalloprotease [Flavobacteriia bacterium]|jgi:RsiW-degrading membrane proteinase PrsW (M82 family)